MWGKFKQHLINNPLWMVDYQYNHNAIPWYMGLGWINFKYDIYRGYGNLFILLPFNFFLRMVFHIKLLWNTLRTKTTRTEQLWLLNLITIRSLFLSFIEKELMS